MSSPFKMSHYNERNEEKKNLLKERMRHNYKVNEKESTNHTGKILTAEAINNDDHSAGNKRSKLVV